MNSASIILKLLLLISLFSNCQRKEADIGDDELDIEREEEYKREDLPKKELELND